MNLKLSGIPEVTQEWFKWHDIGELAVHWHDWHCIEGIDLKDTVLGCFPL